MKKRFGGGAVAALLLLLGAAFSVYTTCFCKPAPRPLVIVSERVIYEFKGDGADPEWSLWRAAFLSPEGRYVILIGRKSNDVSLRPYRGPWFLVDTRTRQAVKLPLPPDCWPNWDGPNPFTSDGKYIHVIEPEERGQGPGRPWVLLYDIANRTLRTIKVGPAQSVVSDARAENLLVSTPGQNVTVSIASGAVATLPFEGDICASFGDDRAIVQFRDASELTVVDVAQGTATKKFHLQGQQGNYPPFQTADGRFLCYTDFFAVPDYLARAWNYVARILPFGRVSQGVGWRIEHLACFWDSAEDREIRLHDVFPIAPGPTKSTVWNADGGYRDRQHLLDIATGAEYIVGRHGCASGSRLVYEVQDKDGGVKIMMIEVALPEPAR